MKRSEKRQCIDILNTIEEAHSEAIRLIKAQDMVKTGSLLADCQDAAISIGNRIEASEGEGTKAVHMLEDYCETVYRLNEQLQTGEVPNLKKLQRRLSREIRNIKCEVESIRSRIEAVFLPYKASMWDSLESVWMAADGDENCDAYVIPIPYYDKNPDGSFLQIHYEIDQYPDYVPVIGYGDYRLGERHPDMIFFHNPYDDWNIVTSVHPDFFSDKLRQYTDCLVYIPYFATTGIMSEGQGLCPAYRNADYIVVQSKDMIRQYDKSIPREKFLPLGSPKFDRVIRLCQNPPKPPEDWKRHMQGRRVFFFNTSIAGMLNDTGMFLQKIAYVFNVFKEVDEACILWRPHPLLESTFDSMRPEYKEAYEMIKADYISEDIGIYDTTPDIDATIAQCDYYLGDTATSVTSLFEVAGKPIFALNYEINEAPPEDFWKAWYYQTLRWDGQNQYCILNGNELFKAAVDSDENRYEYQYVRSLKRYKNDDTRYIRAVEIGDKTYLIPANKEEIRIIDKAYNEHIVSLRRGTKEDSKFSLYWVHEKYLILIPYLYPDFVIFDTETEEVRYIEGMTGYTSEDVDGQKVFSARGMWRGRIWFLNTSGDELTIVDIDTGEKTVKKMPLNRLIHMFVVTEIDDDILWGIPYEGTVVTRWDTRTDEFKDYDLSIPGLASINRIKDSDEETASNECNLYYFSGVAKCGEHVVFSPNWANKFVELDVATGTVKEWDSPFEITTDDRDEYYTNWGMGHFFSFKETRDTYFFYAPKRKTYLMDMENASCKEVRFDFDKREVFQNIVRGFDVDGVLNPYCCYEDVFNSLPKIAKGNVYGKEYSSEKQEKIAMKINAAVDGEAGRRIYATLKRAI